MNNGSAYQPDFVVIEDEVISPETTIEESTINRKEAIGIDEELTDDNFNQREIDFLKKQRVKLRLCDPKGVCFYRHIVISHFQSVIHLVSLFISSYLIYSLFRASNPMNTEFIQGLGSISNTTFIEKFTNIILLVIVLRSIHSLFKLKGEKGIKRYKLAMLSNAINLVVIKSLKIIILLFFFLGLYISQLTASMEFDEALRVIENGVFADVMEAILSFLSIIIVVRAFRFCKQEMAE